MTWHYQRQDRLTISVDEAAELVGIAPDTIRRAVIRCENIGFPVIKAGRRYVVLQVPPLTVLGGEPVTNTADRVRQLLDDAERTSRCRPTWRIERERETA